MKLADADRLSDPSADLSGRNRSYVRESFPAVPGSVPTARGAVIAVAERAGVTGWQLDAIRLSVSEALTNVVKHAYPARIGHMHLTVRIAGGELWVLIADSGCGIHAGRESEGLGLGLALISQSTDGFSIVERSSGGTELRLVYKLHGSHGPFPRCSARAREVR